MLLKKIKHNILIIKHDQTDNKYYIKILQSYYLLNSKKTPFIFTEAILNLILNKYEEILILNS